MLFKKLINVIHELAVQMKMTQQDILKESGSDILVYFSGILTGNLYQYIDVCYMARR